MHSQPDGNHILPRVAEGTRTTALDIFGPTVEFLTSPQDAHQDFCVMRGVIPPGVSVPLHSHDDTETFFVLSGTKQVLIPGAYPGWTDEHAGDYVHLPRGRPHAHRNVSGEPLIELVITTARLGSWFQEVGKTGHRRSPATGTRRPCP